MMSPAAKKSVRSSAEFQRARLVRRMATIRKELLEDDLLAQERRRLENELHELTRWVAWLDG